MFKYNKLSVIRSKTIRFKFNERNRNAILLIIFVFSFLSYLNVVFDVTLFKYVQLSDLFSQERFYSQGINIVPFSDWNVDRSGMYRDVILNVILFFPFGFLLQMISKRNKLSAYSIAIPVMVSIFLEILQYVFHLGITDITDIISNTCGAAFGCLSYRLFNAFFRKKQEKANERLLYVIFIVAIICFSL